jgi:hypothetical protein
MLFGFCLLPLFSPAAIIDSLPPCFHLRQRPRVMLMPYYLHYAFIFAASPCRFCFDISSFFATLSPLILFISFADTAISFFYADIAIPHFRLRHADFAFIRLIPSFHSAARLFLRRDIISAFAISSPHYYFSIARLSLFSPPPPAPPADASFHAAPRQPLRFALFFVFAAVSALAAMPATILPDTPAISLLISPATPIIFAMIVAMPAISPPDAIMAAADMPYFHFAPFHTLMPILRCCHYFRLFSFSPFSLPLPLSIFFHLFFHYFALAKAHV